jgi:stress response protein YsnF
MRLAKRAVAVAGENCLPVAGSVVITRLSENKRQTRLTARRRGHRHPAAWQGTNMVSIFGPSDPDKPCPPDQACLVIPLHAETAEVTRETKITGTVKVETSTLTRRVDIDEQLLDQFADIERVAIGRAIDAMPELRHEGDTTIVPVVEERLVVERRLFLKEEIRITRRNATRHHHETLSLRSQTATVTRVPAEET